MTAEQDEDEAIEAVLAAARVLVALSAQSVAALSDTVTLPQLRVLVMVASRAPMNLNAVADALEVHPSNATRTVERLVAAGLLDRRDDPADRRHLLLDLTTDGRALVTEVMQRRRAAVAEILSRMPASHRRQFSVGAAGFAATGGEVPDRMIWSLGWTTAG